ncbi:hypothetical protein HDU91_003188, partial [Kappamyces sp. JEL0680]
IGAYGRDIGTNIIELLWAVIRAMDRSNSKAMLRVGMTNPPYMLEHISELAKVLCHPRVYAFLHVPVQAGSTKVLESMRRLYKIEDFEKVCDTLLENVPGITIATDIICGFPGESEEDFGETLRILAKYQFPVLHISQFYPRPGTPAARMKKIPTAVVKDRSRRATALFESYTTFDRFVGTVQSILVTEVSTDGAYYVGHNKSFQQVLVRKDPRVLGHHVSVRITSATKWSMKAEILPESLMELSNVSVSRNPRRLPKQAAADGSVAEAVPVSG